MKKHKKLTKTERERIAVWKKEGLSNIQCAKRLGRDVSTIGREISRNKFKVETENGNNWEHIYEPEHAQVVSEQRKQNAWIAKEPLKRKKIFAYVLQKLASGWSPEQIAGRLKYEHSNDPSWHICHETIYQFIYKKKIDRTKQSILQQSKKTVEITITDFNRPLWEYLRRKQKKRRKRNGRKVHRSHIPDRVSIHQRPKIIQERKEFGHWEGDSIVGKKRQSGLHTEYERVASYTRMEKVLKITGEQMIKAAKAIFEPLPSKARQSTTLDNGTENHEHSKLKDLGMQTYFADPYSSWQRGGNENCNLWIRCYFPKGTDFNTITDEELKDVEWELNNRPRKRLGFRTPQEVFDENLKSIQPFTM